MATAALVVIAAAASVFYNREQGNAQYNIISAGPELLRGRLSTPATDQHHGVGPHLPHDAAASIPWPARRRHRPRHDEHQQSRLAAHVPGSSAGIARRIPWHHTIEAGYVGTFGRHLAAQHQINSVRRSGPSPAGAIGNADLCQPRPPGRPPAQRRQLSPAVPDAAEREHLRGPSAESSYNAPPDDAEPAGRALHVPGRLHVFEVQGTVGDDFAPQIDPLDPSALLRRPPGRPHRTTWHFSWTARLGDPVRTASFG